jgi:deazaflavin-dependent oxidoreductase (nitroreductase family)
MNEPVIEEFRANAGKLRQRRLVLLLTTTGVKSGLPRLTPLNYSKDGDRLVVIASKGGSETDPAWYRNLLAQPVVTIEVGSEVFQARATPAIEPERTRLYDQQVALMPFFDGYRKAVSAREIPVVVFERAGQNKETA